MALFGIYKPALAQVRGRWVAGSAAIALLCDMIICNFQLRIQQQPQRDRERQHPLSPRCWRRPSQAARRAGQGRDTPVACPEAGRPFPANAKIRKTLFREHSWHPGCSASSGLDMTQTRESPGCLELPKGVADGPDVRPHRPLIRAPAARCPARASSRAGNHDPKAMRTMTPTRTPSATGHTRSDFMITALRPNHSRSVVLARRPRGR